MVLEKYRIGDVEDVALLVRYERQGDDDTLYTELKDAVNEYFRENKVGMSELSQYSLLFVPGVTNVMMHYS